MSSSEFSKRAVGLVLTLASSLAGAAPNVVPGLWETTVTVHVEGGSFPMPAIKSRKCINQNDLVPNSVQSNMRCNMSEPEVDGNDVSWKVNCADERGEMTGEAKITYAGDHFEGNMDVLIEEIGGDRSLKMKYVMRGMRMRACNQAR